MKNSVKMKNSEKSIDTLLPRYLLKMVTFREKLFIFESHHWKKFDKQHIGPNAESI